MDTPFLGSALERLLYVLDLYSGTHAVSMQRRRVKVIVKATNEAEAGLLPDTDFGESRFPNSRSGTVHKQIAEKSNRISSFRVDLKIAGSMYS
jgi:hypothetical protein